MMQITRQTVGTEGPIKPVSTSKSGKSVPIKKRESKSSRFVTSGDDTITSADSSNKGESSLTEDLDARIAKRAYELYQQRGGCHGEDQADWFEAERQILS